MRLVAAFLLLSALPAAAQDKKRAAPPLPYPPTLPEGKESVTHSTPEFLKPISPLREGVEIAKTPPTVDFLYYPGQDHPGKPWSVWGDGCASGDKYYSAIGDHLSPKGTAQVYEYDATTKKLRLLVDLRKFFESSNLLPPDMNYIPGKIHSRIELGKDGWLYYSTHRGSPSTTNDQHGYKGDWVLRTHPESGATEVVARFPVPKHAIPTSVLDPERLIFYGGTAPGKDAAAQEVQFFAWDIQGKRLLLSAGGGPKRCAILSRSTGRLTWDGKMFDPERSDRLGESKAPDVRSATQETPQGIVYGTTDRSADLWAYDVKNDTLTMLGPGAVGKQEYTTTIDADPTGRYLYYIPGGHGGGPTDGTPVVQYDVKLKKRKVIAFLHPFHLNAVGYTLEGTFGSALDPKGERLYITWNGMRKEQPRGWESCALTVVHIPASERQP